MKIYGDIRSGNCYKIKLLTSIIELDHEWLDVDILVGATTTETFLAKNPVGKTPLLELEGGRLLSESNAILNFLAEDTGLLPADSLGRAKVQQWQFYEQYSHEPYIAVARFISRYLVGDELTTADISLYGYTHVADEGGFSLAGYPAIQNWIARIQAYPSYVGME